MARLVLICEGFTEEKFVDEVLAPHLFRLGFYMVLPRVIPTGRRGATVFRGGGVSLDRVAHVARQTLQEDSSVYVTTLLDYYRFPLREHDPCLGTPIPVRKAQCIEQVLYERATQNVAHPERFVPYLQMFEFEALLFASVGTVSEFLGLDHHQRIALEQTAQDFEDPETINGGETMKPAARLEAVGYAKPADGPIIARDIGLAMIRTQCARFNEWLTRLEDLAAG